MRLRVDLRSGYASFDLRDEERAWELYRECGLRVVLCEDLGDDDGIVLAGPPLGVDLKHQWYAA